MADIVLQAGHVFRKTGSTGTRAPDGDPTEQEVAWAVCLLAASVLNERGHNTRVVIADPQRHEYRGDVFVAVHCDGSSSPKAHGASVGYRTDEGEELALEWKRQYAKGGWVGFRADNYTAALQGYYGCKRAIEQGNRQACIVELGFLTNPTNEAQLASSTGRGRAALSIAAAIERFYPPPHPPEENEMPVLAWFRTKAGSNDNAHCYKVIPGSGIAVWMETHDHINTARFLGAQWWGGSENEAYIDPVVWQSNAVFNGPCRNGKDA